jgi:3-oxoadipate enol-lactonase
MPEIAIGDARVAYDFQGAPGGAQTLILLHGTTQDRNAWATVVPALPATYRVVAPEFPGSGQTTDGGGPLDIDDIVAQVVAVADDAGAAQFHLAGCSLGAVIAAAVAANAGSRLSSLTLLCGWAKSDAHIRFELDLWRRLLDTDIALFLRHAFSHGFTDGWFETTGDDEAGIMVDGAIAQVNGPGAARQAELDTRIDITARLAHISAPTLVIGATHDRFIPFHHSEALANGIAEARLEAIDAGHFCIVERADEVTRMLVDHIGSH